MKKFEILEHKADFKIKAFGKNLEELFENAMLGMFEGARYQEEGKDKEATIAPPRPQGGAGQPSPTLSKKAKAVAKVKIKIKSIDLSSLLVDFLSEILYLVETRKEVYQKIDFKKFSESEIKAELTGKKLKRIGVQIKAVTYHNLDIHQKKDGDWEATILFDV